MRAGKAIAALLLAVPGVVGVSSAFAAGDRTAGAAKAMQCQTCHGRQGMATMPGVPNLAGQNDGYLAAQLRAFRAGARTNEQMSIIAKPLTDQDIENLAAYFSQIKVTVVAD